MLKSLFNKVASLQPESLLKEDSKQVFSREYSNIFKNTYFEEYLRTAVSGTSLSLLLEEVQKLTLQHKKP